MSSALQSTISGDSLFGSYAQLVHALTGDVTGACLLDENLNLRGHSGRIDTNTVCTWLRSLQWTDHGPRAPVTARQGADQWVTALALEQTHGALLGVFCVQRPAKSDDSSLARHTRGTAQQLRPVLDCLHRELAASRPERSKIQTLTERTAELEWLFKVTTNLQGATNQGRIAQELLSAAAERLRSAFGVLVVPDKRLCIEHEHDAGQAPALRQVWEHTRQHLITWAQRQRKPLVINSAGRNHPKLTPCKILSVPIVRDSGRVIGLLAFFNPRTAPDYESRHAFLARHLGRQSAAIVEAQFDLMTGLYTRGGLEQTYGQLPDDGSCDGSVIYIDVDHMHVANELDGFELGNELIVRIADLMAPPLLPQGALAARLSGDRFALVLPATDPRAARKIAEELQAAARQLVIGSAQNPIEASVSCGIAALVAMPQGLQRALAAAEIACKTAKGRGQGRIELYACEDHSMMRRQDDVVAVGQLRAAFKTDRLMLYAQRIVPLQNNDLPGGYEILMRLRDADSGVVLPGALLNAAHRYQLLPSVDRWVVQQALQTLAPYRSMLRTRGISISINVSGQSIGDETFIRQFSDQLKEARLPAGCITIELTEQAAVTNLVRANEMIRGLSTLGCRFALDDFGTGSNSLTYLKTLQISRLKIDGSFVRDIASDTRSRTTVRGIVELAKGFSVDTVAEYVENTAIADVVRKLGVDYAQGYAFGKPEPLKDVLEGLAQEESRRLHRLFLEM